MNKNTLKNHDFFKGFNPEEGLKLYLNTYSMGIKRNSFKLKNNFKETDYTIKENEINGEKEINSYLQQLKEVII